MKPLRVLVGCEFSGIVRDAFAALGHDAWSCDLLPTERPGQHIEGDVLTILDPNTFPTRGFWEPWDLMIAHPPCDFLTVSNNNSMTHGCSLYTAAEGRELRNKAIGFFMLLAGAPIHRIAIENPVGIMSSVWRKPDQIIQPWQFGHGETKATCLWLKNLPPLQPTHLEGDLFAIEAPSGRIARVHREPPGPDRWKNRSRTFEGVASAMAQQWGIPFA